MMDVQSKNGKQVVYLKGEINAESGAAVKKQVLDLFGGNDIVVMSFQGVVYMNSSGLREIIDLLKQANKTKKELRVTDMSKDIREMFSFTGLDKVFKIFESEAQALE